MKYGARIIRFLVCAGMVLVYIISCASEEKKTPPQGALTAERAFKLVQDVKDAFLKRDLRKLQSLCSEDVYNELSGRTETFRGSNLEFGMRWVDIDKDGTVHLYVAWKRKTIIGDKEGTDTGMAAFVIKAPPFVVDDILRENPFVD